MIAPSGFVSLFDLTRRKMDAVAAKFEAEYSYERWERVAEGYEGFDAKNAFDRAIAYQSLREEVRFEDSARCIWKRLENTKDACVFPFSERPFFVSPYVFSFTEAHSMTGLYVDLMVGSIGSGMAFGKFTHPEDENQILDAEHEMHPYHHINKMKSVLNLPICLPTPLSESLLEDADEIETSDMPGTSDADIVQAIVDRFDNGDTVTKAWARSELCGGMKHAVFLALWRAAALRRPELSKPGPRGPH